MQLPGLPRIRLGEDDQHAADRQTASLAGLAVTLLLIVVSLFLLRQLQITSRVEDCMLANRINCDMLVARLR